MKIQVLIFATRGLLAVSCEQAVSEFFSADAFEGRRAEA